MLVSIKLKDYLKSISQPEKTENDCFYFYFSDCKQTKGWIEKPLDEVLTELNLKISSIHQSGPGECFVRCNLKNKSVVTFITYGLQARELYEKHSAQPTA